MAKVKVEKAKDESKIETKQQPKLTIEIKTESSPREYYEEVSQLKGKKDDLVRGLQRGLFGINHVPRTAKIRTSTINPDIDNLERLMDEFLLDRRGKHDSESTINTYKKHFFKIFDFLGFSYARQSAETVIDALEDDDFPDAKDVGRAMPIRVLETENIAAYYQDYLRNVRHNSEQTVISAMRHFKAIVRFAQENNWIKEYRISIKDVQPDIKPILTVRELEELARKPKSDDFVPYRCWVMIKYLMATGNRISSLLALNVEDVNFEDNCITVNVQKNKKPKLMPLNNALRKVLAEYIRFYRSDEDKDPLYKEPLFCNAYGGRLAYHSAKDAMADYFESRHVEWRGFHIFRHTYAAYWIKDGGNPLMLKEQLGHTSLAMTNRYANIYGMATKDEAEAHSLINRVAEKSGRKAIKKRED